MFISNLSCGYDNKQIIHDISFKINEGEVLSILGANGSGKSTLLKAIVGILPYQGDVSYANENLNLLSVKKRASLIAYVPQSSTIPFDFNVLEIVLMGRFHSSTSYLGYSKQDKIEALEALEEVGMKNFTTRIFKNLSGGERQLVLIARALAQKSRIIIMDEPVTGLDFGNQMRLLELIARLSKDGKIIIQTTHYPDHALRVSDKVLWLDKGKILAFGVPKEVITEEKIFNIYKVKSKLIYNEAYDISYVLPMKFIQKETQ
jgi:iron complex transport system ATP-binding protein